MVRIKTQVRLQSFPDGASGKEFTSQCRRQETWVQFLDQEDGLEEGIATHSSILAWRISETEEPGGLQSMGSQRVRHKRSDLVLTSAAHILKLEQYRD